MKTNGAFTHKQPVGRVAQAMATHRLIAIVFGGLIYILALTGSIASGMHVYFARRRQQGNPAPRLHAAWAAIVWRTPPALIFTLFATLVAEPGAMILVGIFWTSLLLLTAHGARIGHRAIKQQLLIVNTVGLVAICTYYVIRHQAAALTMASLPILIAMLVTATVFLTMGWLGCREGEGQLSGSGDKSGRDSDPNHSN